MRSRISTGSYRFAGRLIGGLIAIGLTACSSFDVINAVTLEQHQSKTAGIEYSTHGLKLDIYKPEPAAPDDRRWPVVVFFYGGGWESGTRDDYRFVASGLTKHDLLVVVADYRKFPDAQFPVFVDDAAAATAWVYREIDGHNGDREQIYVAGHSAGAHIAALLHFDERYLKRQGIQARPAGFIGLSGPYDFLPLVSDRLKAIFPAAIRAQSQPVAFVDGSEGPSLLIHGLRDTVVVPRNSAKLHETILARGGKSELVVLTARRHASVVLSLAPPFQFLAATTDAISRHIKRNGSFAPN